MRILTVTTVLVALVHLSITLDAQTSTRRPRVELQSAPLIRLSGEADSNSPAVWDRVAGRNLLFVMTSMSGRPSTASGRGLTQLGTPRAVVLEPWPGGGVWMEAVIKDVDGTWYGYYHNETVANMCRQTDKVIPRIGAARSRDRGATWEPLGVMLEAPPRTYDCTTDNAYFVGGVGDFSVQLDPASRDLYLFHSLYLREQRSQGVGVARLAWADRDYGQEGIYVSFAESLDHPALWSAPVKILNGGRWYPQVLGIEDGSGSDKTAGELARFFMLGTSQHFIRFLK